jgi:hypothetical protein
MVGKAESQARASGSRSLTRSALPLPFLASPPHPEPRGGGLEPTIQFTLPIAYLNVKER